ncbi:DUF6653 family protein [Roseibium algae]|uniref:DUF6653 family protein n=1 Tax=Roseibium algae TaxID=3123038 RepID=A0ABU8TK44_9HYPH
MSQVQNMQRPRPMPSPMPAGQLKALGMDPAVWQRHASPWSVYSRMATLPFLICAIWSHNLYGFGVAAIATIAVLVWLWINPRLFPAPKSTDSWASKATFGERIWLNRMSVPIPPQEAKTALVLSLVTGVGFLVALYGAYADELLIAGTGMIVTYAGKLVFLNRMVQLYDRMRNSHPLYRFWSIFPDNDNSKRAKAA